MKLAPTIVAKSKNNFEEQVNLYQEEKTMVGGRSASLSKAAMKLEKLVPENKRILMNFLNRM